MFIIVFDSFVLTFVLVMCGAQVNTTQLLCASWDPQSKSYRPCGYWTHGHIMWAAYSTSLSPYYELSVLPAAAAPYVLSVVIVRLLASPGWSDMNIRMRWISSICLIEALSGSYIYWPAYINTNVYCSSSLCEILIHRFFLRAKPRQLKHFIRYTIIHKLHPLI